MKVQEWVKQSKEWIPHSHYRGLRDDEILQSPSPDSLRLPGQASRKRRRRCPGSILFFTEPIYVTMPFHRGRIKDERINKQRGITLLEIMFVMIIAAMITTAAFMYYGSVQRNQEINSAIQLIQQIIAAVDNYRHPPDDITVENGVAVSTTAPTDYYQGINPNLVANSGFVPQQYLQQDAGGEKGTLGITTPWFGDSYIDIEAGTGAQGTYVITLYSIPNYACTTLARQLKTMRDSNAHCDAYQSEQVTCNGSTLTMVNYSVGRMYCPTR